MYSKYKDAFIKSIDLLEKKTNGEYNLKSYAIKICENQNQTNTINLYKLLNDIVESNSDEEIIVKGIRNVKNHLLLYYGAIEVSSMIKPLVVDYSYEELLIKLNNLIGLNEVKDKVQDLIAFQKVQEIRRNNGLDSPIQTLHMSFIGNPGTGKTTVARIVGHLYKHLGLLTKGHFIEVSRTDLISGYQGQTALKVQQIIKRAKGGVLFIDEAYSITENENTDSYGRECLTELTKALEDYREDLVVIVAGYKAPMIKFFKSNPGLKSRFNTFIEFKDYDHIELFEILQLMCFQNDYKINVDAISKVQELLLKTVSDREENFSNGRFVRNVYNHLILEHAKRVASIVSPSTLELQEIKLEDVLYNKELSRLLE
jgi:SpoVK/Ycf46/Vps4 family AAA+-type ATPase